LHSYEAEHGTKSLTQYRQRDFVTKTEGTSPTTIESSTQYEERANIAKETKIRVIHNALVIINGVELKLIEG
jgi:hypothetical protein